MSVKQKNGSIKLSNPSLYEGRKERKEDMKKVCNCDIESAFYYDFGMYKCQYCDGILKDLIRVRKIIDANTPVSIKNRDSEIDKKLNEHIRLFNMTHSNLDRESLKEYRNKFNKMIDLHRERNISWVGSMEEIWSFIEKALIDKRKEGYKLGVKNALDLISACYSPQSHNYNEEVQKDITKARELLNPKTK